MFYMGVFVKIFKHSKILFQIQNLFSLINRYLVLHLFLCVPTMSHWILPFSQYFRMFSILIIHVLINLSCFLFFHADAWFLYIWLVNPIRWFTIVTTHIPDFDNDHYFQIWSLKCWSMLLLFNAIELLYFY